MRSRLAELEKYRLPSGDDEVFEDVELGEAKQVHREEGPQASMAEFFDQVEEVKRGIDRANKAARRVRDITEERMLCVTEAKEASLSAELRKVVEATNTKLKKTKRLLEEMSEETTTLTKEGKPSEVRIRENLVMTLTRKFGETAQDYQRAQQRYAAETYGSVKRQLEIVQPDISDDQVREVLQTGTMVSSVYKSAIVKGNLRSAYEEVHDKYQDVLRLEQSVQELHQMFLDFALLVGQQGELLDQIEYQVKNANNYVEKGNTDLQVAIVYQRSIRRKWCCLIIVLLLIVGVILFYIFVISDLGGKGGKNKN